MKVTEPKSANPTTNPIALVVLNVMLRKSSGGRIGSSARASMSGNSASSATPPLIAASIPGASQA